VAFNILRLILKIEIIFKKKGNFIFKVNRVKNKANILKKRLNKIFLNLLLKGIKNNIILKEEIKKESLILDLKT